MVWYESSLTIMMGKNDKIDEWDEVKVIKDLVRTQRTLIFMLTFYKAYITCDWDFGAMKIYRNEVRYFHW